MAENLGELTNLIKESNLRAQQSVQQNLMPARIQDYVVPQKPMTMDQGTGVTDGDRQILNSLNNLRGGLSDQVDTIEEGDNQIIKSLNNIFAVLQKQVSLQEDALADQKLANQTTPKEFDTASREKEVGILEEISAKLGGLGGVGGSGGGGILESLGIIKLFDGLKGLFGKLMTSIEGLLPGIGSFAMEMGKATIKWGAFLAIMEQVGDVFRKLTGLPSMEQDAFNMNRDLRRIKPGYEEPAPSPEGEPPYAPSTRPARPSERPGREPRPGGGEEPTTTREPNRDKKFDYSRINNADPKRVNQAMKFFIDKGFTPQQASGIVGNMLQENPKFGLGAGGDNGAAAGLFQWQGPRQKGMGKTFESQLQHAYDEMTGNAPNKDPGAEKAYKLVKESKTSGEAAKHFVENFERPMGVVKKKQNPKAYHEEIRKRSGFAEAALDLYGRNGETDNPATRVTGEPESTPDKIKSNYSQDDYKEALSFLKSRAEKGDDVWNLDADYAVKLSRGMKKAEERFGEKTVLYSGFRSPTDRQKKELGSTGSSQEQVRGYRPGKLKGIAGVYGSMHGMGGAADVRLSSKTGGPGGTMNKMSGKTRADWIRIMEEEGLDIPMRPDGTVPSEHEMWHVEQKGLKRGGASGYGLKGQEYTDYIKSRSLRTAVEKGSPTRTAIWDKKKKSATQYAKAEKEIPERVEEESEQEETTERVQTEPTTTDKNITVTRSDDSTAKGAEISSKAKSFFGSDQINEQNLVAQKQEALGMTPYFGQQGRQQGPTGGIFNPQGQNPFYNMQRVLGGIGSAAAMGQGMSRGFGRGGNPMGNIYGVMGGVRGVMGAMGQQSPMMNTASQVLGTVGSVMGTASAIGNMGRYGGGGVVGGINAASMGMGMLGNITGLLNSAAKGISENVFPMFGRRKVKPGEKVDKEGNTIVDDIKWESIPNQQRIGQRLAKEPTVKKGDEIPQYTPEGYVNLHGQTRRELESGIGAKGLGEDTTSNVPNQQRIGQRLAKEPTISFMGIGSDAAAVNARYSMEPSTAARGVNLEGMTKSVQAGKEDRMTPSETPPTIINQGGGGGGGASGGGGGGGDSPTAGVMGVSIPVRNEEPTLLTVQFGSVRVV